MESASRNVLSKPKGTRPVLLILTGLFCAAVIAGVLWLKEMRSQPQVDPVLRSTSLGFVDNGPHKLDPAFTDKDGDLVADPPSDPAKFIDPPKLVFCFVATESAAASKIAWQPFTDYLSKVTGKPVEYLMVTSTHEEIKAMHDGHLQVAAFNTGGVPPAVDLAGFVPVCALPTDAGSVTHSEIIVPTDSPLQKPEDLKGHELTLTDPTSNSGYKAPLFLMRQKFGLQPDADFWVRCSQSYETSIDGIIAHRYEAAAVADDMLQREVAAGTVKDSQFRIIFKSDGFPTAGLGYVYNLEPSLARKVRQALLDFDWKGTSLESMLNSSTRTKFVAVSFKQDWAMVRQIDDQMGLLSGF
jgi:phosphonate transport system substrate-binding protein